MIENIIREAKVGEIYDAKVVRIESFGCFVNLFGDVDGLCHVSRLAWERVNHPKDVVKLGQTLKVIASPFWISMKGLRDFLFCLFFIGLDDVSP